MTVVRMAASLSADYFAQVPLITFRAMTAGRRCRSLALLVAYTSPG